LSNKGAQRLPAPERLTTPPEPAPPEALVRQFYQEWITTEGNPIQLRAYDNTDYVTPDFIHRIDQHISEQDSIVADPLLCAQDMPTQIEVGEATITGDTARVTVQMHWPLGPNDQADVRHLLRQRRLKRGIIARTFGW
jgi:hypothetical protein